MKISEIFESIQGEGNTIGRISLFIRVQGCPLDCIWCDSKYSVSFKEGIEKTKKEIIDTINLFVKNKNGIIVFTGGEPLYYQKEIAEILKEVETSSIEFETSGIYLPIEELKKYKFNVSPKLSGAKLSGGKLIYTKIYSNLKEFVKLNSIFKFVISTPEELKEVKEIIQKYNIPKEKVFLMPEGTKIEELVEKSKYILPFCLEEGINYSFRLQILLRIK